MEALNKGITFIKSNQDQIEKYLSKVFHVTLIIILFIAGMFLVVKLGKSAIGSGEEDVQITDACSNMHHLSDVMKFEQDALAPDNPQRGVYADAIRSIDELITRRC